MRHNQAGDLSAPGSVANPTNQFTKNPVFFTLFGGVKMRYYLRGVPCSRWYFAQGLVAWRRRPGTYSEITRADFTVRAIPSAQTELTSEQILRCWHRKQARLMRQGRGYVSISKEFWRARLAAL